MTPRGPRDKDRNRRPHNGRTKQTKKKKFGSCDRCRKSCVIFPMDFQCQNCAMQQYTSENKKKVSPQCYTDHRALSSSAYDVGSFRISAWLTKKIETSIKKIKVLCTFAHACIDKIVKATRRILIAFVYHYRTSMRTIKVYQSRYVYTCTCIYIYTCSVFHSV